MFAKLFEPYYNISMKEQILQLRSEGKTYNEIINILGCSKSTVSYHCGVGQKEKTKQRSQELRKDNVLLTKICSFKHPTASRCDRRPPAITKPKYRSRKKATDFVRKGAKTNNDLSYQDVLALHGEVTNCYLTGRKIDLREPRTYNFDHKVPASKGGDNSLNNLGIACRDANAAKNDMTIEDFIQLCKEVLEHHNYKVIENGR